MVRTPVSKIALIFPGQGSQYVGMGKDLFLSSHLVRDTFEEADRVLGFKVSSLCFEGPEERLNRTDITQPAILTVSIATYRFLSERFPLRPSFMAGHSLGEYSALVVSGAISFLDALRLVNLRGKFMQEAVPEGIGMMAAILGLQRSVVEELCKAATKGGEIAVPANYNSPEQIVISGHKGAVERVTDMAENNGARRIVFLRVSVPSHSPLMLSAGKKLTKSLEEIEIREMDTPVITNLGAEPLSDKNKVKDVLIKQLSNPVKWEDSILRIKKEGVDCFIELGPGKVLTRLIKRICKDVEVYSFESLNDLERIKMITV